MPFYYFTTDIILLNHLKPNFQYVNLVTTAIKDTLFGKGLQINHKFSNTSDRDCLFDRLLVGNVLSQSIYTKCYHLLSLQAEDKSMVFGVFFYGAQKAFLYSTFSHICDHTHIIVSTVSQSHSLLQWAALTAELIC